VRPNRDPKPADAGPPLFLLRTKVPCRAAAQLFGATLCVYPHPRLFTRTAVRSHWNREPALCPLVP
jgi:hypothetical protein